MICLKYAYPTTSTLVPLHVTKSYMRALYQVIFNMAALKLPFCTIVELQMRLKRPLFFLKKGEGIPPKTFQGPTKINLLVTKTKVHCKRQPSLAQPMLGSTQVSHVWTKMTKFGTSTF